MKTNFFVCEHCGNLVEVVNDGGVPLMCCGQEMTCLQAGVAEASHEKHIPVVNIDGNELTVCVGSVSHPMTAEHNISWVYLKTDKGGHLKHLDVGAQSVIKFALVDEKPLEVYAYCNIHGLWKAEI